MTPFSIHPDTTVGPVYLNISDLARSKRFYRDVIGFKTFEHRDDTLTLTADGTSPLLILKGQPGAHPKPRHTTGLYHFAILVPSRADLARSLRRLIDVHYPLQGASDHLVSEALYLADPDGNGIEIYRDRSRDTWTQQNGQVQMTIDPLDTEELLAELKESDHTWNGLSPGTVIGHMHLHVADLRQAEAFYHGVLGFDVMLRYGPSALFLSAGGYHHHIGLNTWAGIGAPPPPPDTVGLRQFVVALPNHEELERVAQRVRQAEIATEQTVDGFLIRDPSQNGALLAQMPKK
ncbi:VOC family protein [Candidatus Acetothermia bacterium]|nr:VOC family protein [Candidatus Acetothermia bacterium]